MPKGIPNNGLRRRKYRRHLNLSKDGRIKINRDMKIPASPEHYFMAVISRLFDMVEKLQGYNRES